MDDYYCDAICVVILLRANISERNIMIVRSNTQSEARVSRTAYQFFLYFLKLTIKQF